MLFLKSSSLYPHWWQLQEVTSPLAALFRTVMHDNVQNVIVNWQRGTTEVVHSYYHGKDQLDRQSPAYTGRTQLNPDQLKKGNASLSLMGVQASDHGEYTCAVSNEQGSFQEHILLQVAAPYDEPHIDVQVTCDSIILTLTSSEGFPKPTLMWTDMTGSDITNQSTTTLDLNSRGRYDVRSKMEFKSRNTQGVTIEMSLGVLKQGFSRAVTLQPLSECKRHDGETTDHT
ncbi:hypothetical protein AGOR_G00119290 [Albula goreensis]|uniref:Ig-like domain-containing protein n=1 Tax=Albula goreensis TaxID=1534307 RepID=A0A8T3DES3_9TELE|nr:hypothetical protein AGOR_G00119290 [Albula goreensis]